MVASYGSTCRIDGLIVRKECAGGGRDVVLVRGIFSDSGRIGPVFRVEMLVTWAFGALARFRASRPTGIGPDFQRRFSAGA